MDRLYNIAGKEIALFLFRFDLVGSKGVDFVLNVEIYKDMYADIDRRMKPLIHACSETLSRYRKHCNSTTIMDGTIHFDGMFEVMLSKGLGAIIDPKEKEQLFEDARRISDLLQELMTRRTREERGELPPLDFMDEPTSDEEVRQDMGAASAMFYDVGIIPHTVDLALEAGYWAQLPGNWKARPRPSPITSLNFLCFSSFHNFLSGKPTGNPWGEAVTIFKTTSGTPLYFNFHSSILDEDSLDQRLLGNTMLIGQSSSGKTVLLSFLLAQAQKLKPTIVAFDKDRGMEVTIRAMGGRYLPLKTGLPSGFNPFHLEPTSKNLAFLKQLLEKILEMSGEPISHDDLEEIDHAVNAVMGDAIPKHLRRFSTLLQFMPNPEGTTERSRPSVHKRLLKWTGNGQHAWLFDNKDDLLNLDTHTLYGFDLTDFLDDPQVRTPLTMYLLYRTESMIDGRRFMYVFDEFWKPLQDEYFKDLAKNKQKTIRKQNGIFVFATQEPGDALESSIAKTLIQQCATYIFLPNPKADRQDYIEGLKLTETEFNLVRSLGETSRKFLIKQGDNSVVAELNLNGFKDELLVLSGTPDNAELAEEIIAECGEDPDVWLPIYLHHVKGQEA